MCKLILSYIPIFKKLKINIVFQNLFLKEKKKEKKVEHFVSSTCPQTFLEKLPKITIFVNLAEIPASRN